MGCIPVGSIISWGLLDLLSPDSDGITMSFLQLTPSPGPSWSPSHHSAALEEELVLEMLSAPVGLHPSRQHHSSGLWTSSALLHPISGSVHLPQCECWDGGRSWGHCDDEPVPKHHPILAPLHCRHECELRTLQGAAALSEPVLDIPGARTRL